MDRLADRTGLDLQANVSDLFAASLVGGVEPATRVNVAFITVGANLDLGKKLGAAGTTLHFLHTFTSLRHNLGSPSRNFPAEAGGYFPVMAFFNYRTSGHLSRLSFEQRLSDNRLSIEAGRLSLTDSFDVPNCESYLSCVNPVAQFSANLLPPNFASWAGRVQYAASRRTTVQFGIAEDAFGDTATSGYRFGLKNATGVMVLAQLSTSTDFSQVREPGLFSVTGFFDSSPRTNFVDPSHQRHGGIAGAILKFQKVVWRDGGFSSVGLPSRRATTYATLALAPSSYAPYPAFAEAGVNFWGFGPLKPVDHIGVKLSYARVGDLLLDGERQARAAAGGPFLRTNPNQLRIEANAAFEIRPSISFLPLVQYATNVDTYFGPNTARVPRNAVLIGGNLFIDIRGLVNAAVR